jgi:hypothetical protein
MFAAEGSEDVLALLGGQLGGAGPDPAAAFVVADDLTLVGGGRVRIAGIALERDGKQDRERERPDHSAYQQDAPSALSVLLLVALLSHVLALRQRASDDDPLDLVGSFDDLQHLGFSHVALDRELLDITVAA